MYSVRYIEITGVLFRVYTIYHDQIDVKENDIINTLIINDNLINLTFH